MNNEQQRFHIANQILAAIITKYGYHSEEIYSNPASVAVEVVDKLITTLKQTQRTSDHIVALRALTENTKLRETIKSAYGYLNDADVVDKAVNEAFTVLAKAIKLNCD